MPVYFVCNVCKGMSEHGLLIILIYAIFITEHREGVAAIVGRMLFDS